jgi:hypothetical protein
VAEEAGATTVDAAAAAADAEEDGSSPHINAD